MVVTGIFHLELEDLAVTWPNAESDQIYEEKIAENETLVSMRARNLRQAMLLSDLLSQAGAESVEIDALAA